MINCKPEGAILKIKLLRSLSLNYSKLQLLPHTMVAARCEFGANPTISPSITPAWSTWRLAGRYERRSSL